MKFDYDLAVIGAGTAGLVAASAADSFGARVALIEADKVGGDSLWSGAVPSKTLVKSAKVFDLVKRCEEFGVHVEKTKLVWNAVKLRLADVRDEIKKVQRDELAKTKIDQISGQARFIDKNTLEITSKAGARRITAEKFIIATGSRPTTPNIEGLQDAGFITPAGLLVRPNLPKSLVFIGGDSITIEMAQAFGRFGTKITILQADERLLPQEEPEISDLITQLLQNEGAQIFLNAQISRVEPGDSQKTVHFTINGEEQSAKAGEIVVSVGTEPYFEGLDLANAGVQLDSSGLMLDEDLRTSAANIWACGDVTGGHLFAHAAEYEAEIAAKNALRSADAEVDYSAVPWVTFTDPEIAQLGLTRAAAEKLHDGVKVWKSPFKTLDRAIIEGETSGFIQVITTNSGEVLGVHIIGPSAGELIVAYIPTVRDGALLEKFTATVFPYPTLTEIGRKVANVTKG